MKTYINRVLSSFTVLALVLSSFAGLLVPVTANATAPIRKFSAAATPSVIAAPGTAEFTVTFTNDSTSDDDINAGRVTLPSGFTLLTPPEPTLDGVTDWEVCSAASEIQFGGIGNAAGVAPGDSFSVTFTASVAASAGEYTFEARAFKNSSCNPGAGAEFDSNITPIVVTVNNAPAATDLSIVAEYETATSSVVTGTDTDGDTLTYSLVTGPTHGLLVFNLDGSFTYTPDNGYSGADSFTFKANDGEEDSSPATVSITINPSEGGNAAPVAQNGSIVTNKNAASSTVLIATDIDLDSLVYSIVTQAVNGIAAVVGDTVTYTPNTDYTGSDSFTFKANDGTVDSNIAAVAVTVNPVVPDNATPVANPLAIVTDYQIATSTVVSGSDTDADDVLTFATSTNPTHGSLVFNADGSFTYTPDNGYSGADSFMFTATDGKVSSAPASVSITVNAAVVVPLCSDNEDNDEDQLVDENDPGCHTDGNANNPDSYDPNDNSETDPIIDTPACSDGIDNDEDGKTDATDPGCMTDGEYNPQDDDETDPTTPPTDVCTNIDGVQETVPSGYVANDGVCEEQRSSGGGGGNRRGSVRGASTGEVLGASCGLYMDRYLKLGAPTNDEVQVIKLQAFLNTEGLFNRVPTGVFDMRTHNAVKDFQEKYFTDILTPWGLTGPTGLVYLTTLHKINMIECPDLMLQVPPLTPWTSTTNTKFAQ